MTVQTATAGSAVPDYIAELFDDPHNRYIVEQFNPSELEFFLLTYLQHDLTDAIPAFHRALLRHVEASSELAVLAPRGHGKSIILTKGYPAYAIATGRARGILICSANAQEAQRRVKDLRHLFETSELLRKTFHVKLGREFDASWSGSDLSFMVNGQLCQVWGRGMTSQIRGIHPDLVIIDDPEETKGAASADVRNTVFEVFARSILPTRNPKDNAGRAAKVFLIGTPINAEVLVQKAYTNWEGRFDSYARLRFKAIEDGETQQLTNVPIGESIFPSRFPLAYLEEERRRLGPHAFAAEYLCNPMPSGAQLFYEEYFKERYSSLPPDHHMFTVVSVDPARTTADAKEGSDTAFTVGSVDKADLVEPRIFIRAAHIAHLAPRERARLAVQLALQFGAEYIWVEDTTKAQRGGITAPSDVVDLIRLTASDLGVEHKFTVLAHRPSVDKYTRAQRAAAICEQGRVLLPANLAGHLYALYSQLLLFPNAEKNDGVDSFSQLVEKLLERHRGAAGRLTRSSVIQQHGPPSSISKRLIQGSRFQPLTRGNGVQPWM